MEPCQVAALTSGRGWRCEGGGGPGKTPDRSLAPFLALAGDRRTADWLAALGWVAVGSSFDVGATQGWPDVRLLRRLGGDERANCPPGGVVLTSGPRRPRDHLA